MFGLKTNRRNRVRALVGVAEQFRLSDKICPSNAHFIFADSSISNDGALSVHFKEAGLGRNEIVNFALTADATFRFGFVNHGGNVVNGTPFTVTGATIATGSFSSGKNGNITATLTGDAPEPPADFQAPNPSWHLVLEVTYTNVRLTDLDNNVFITAADQHINTFPGA